MTKLSDEEQIKRIKAIMKPETKVKVPAFTFPSGEHKGKTLEFIYEHDQDYLHHFYYNFSAMPRVVEAFIEKNVLRGFN